METNFIPSPVFCKKAEITRAVLSQRVSGYKHKGKFVPPKYVENVDYKWEKGKLFINSALLPAKN